MFEAIIFDMDGVIIDSEPLWKRAEISVFKYYGFDFTIEMCNQTKGMRIDEVTKYWKKKLNADFDEHQVADKIVNSLIELVKKEGKPISGLIEVLESVQAQHLKIGLASSSPMNIINSVLDKLEIRNYFNVICSAEKEPFGKPHPAVFISTAEKLHTNPESCLVIEDSLTGVIAAKAAKMSVVAMPEKDDPNLAKFIIADSIINSFKELKI